MTFGEGAAGILVAALVKQKARDDRHDGTDHPEKQREHRLVSHLFMMPLAEDRAQLLKHDQDEDPDRQVQQQRVKMADEANDVRHLVAVWRTGEEWHGDETASREESEKGECPRLFARSRGKVGISHGWAGLRSRTPETSSPNRIFTHQWFDRKPPGLQPFCHFSDR